MKTHSTTKTQMPVQAHRVSRYAEDTVFAFLPSVLRPPVANQLQHIWNGLYRMVWYLPIRLIHLSLV